MQSSNAMTGAQGRIEPGCIVEVDGKWLLVTGRQCDDRFLHAGGNCFDGHANVILRAPDRLSESQVWQELTFLASDNVYVPRIAEQYKAFLVVKMETCRLIIFQASPGFPLRCCYEHNDITDDEAWEALEIDPDQREYHAARGRDWQREGVLRQWIAAWLTQVAARGGEHG